MPGRPAREPASRCLLDVALAGAGLVALAPLMGVIAVAVRLDSEGPILYRATRAGRGGVPFTMYKFRTMRVRPAGQGDRITRHGDDRVTRVGRFLRAGRLDELPQLWNVLVGDMSLVGPRPEDPHYVELYTPEQRRVLDVRPGVTSLASLRFRDEQRLLVGDDWERTYRERVMPAKLEIDRAYVERASLGLDLRILAATALLAAGLGRLADRLLADDPDARLAGVASPTAAPASHPPSARPRSA
jgi:lipopolysaccharide/colanic/teichoic acid biosynthesis glycosyltransferase